MHRRHAPLFEIDEHNNYRAIPFSDPIYNTPTPLPPHTTPHQHQHNTHTHLTSPSSPTGLQLFLSDLHKLSWRTVADWVLKPFISGLAFGMGSYGSRYIVHALMVRYSDYHVPADMGVGGSGEGQAGSTGGGEVGGGKGGGGGVAAAEGTAGVVAEAVAHQMSEQMSGGSQSLAVTPAHHTH